LGDRTRLLLLSRLGDGRPQSIMQLTQDTGLTRQGVSKHLSLMEQARIISSERIGRECRYVIRPEALSEARDYLERASRQWDEAIERLRRLVEE
jgi:DNA-binding transcriptional ArsR family regulator